MLKLKYILYYSILLTIVGEAVTLERLIQENLIKQPQIRVAIAKYEASKYSLEEAKAGYRPTVDVRGELGREETEIEYSFDGTHSLDERQVSLIGSYNLFEGYKTKHKIHEKEASIEVSRNRVLQTLNQMTSLMVKVYLEVLRKSELLQIEEQNYQNHLQTLEKVRLRLEAGDGYESDYRQTKARVKLAEGNRLIAKRAYLNAEINYRKFFRTLPRVESMIAPTVSLNLQESQLNEALKEAEEKSYDMQIQQAKTAVAKSLFAQEQSRDYPTLDIEVSHAWNNNVHGFEGRDRSSKVALVLNYNLYNGGADQAAKRRALKNSEAQEESLDEVKLNIEEELHLALMSYNILERQVELSQEQLHHLEGTRELYELEYQNSKRTIIDLLNIKQEYAYAKTEAINAHYDQLLAYYQFKQIKSELLEAFHLEDILEGL